MKPDARTCSIEPNVPTLQGWLGLLGPGEESALKEQGSTSNVITSRGPK